MREEVGVGGLTYRSQIVEAILSGHLVGEFIVNALTETDQEWAGEHWLITAANNTCDGPHTDARMHLREQQQWQYHADSQHAKVQESPCSSDAPCIWPHQHCTRVARVVFSPFLLLVVHNCDDGATLAPQIRAHFFRWGGGGGGGELSKIKAALHWTEVRDTFPHRVLWLFVNNCKMLLCRRLRLYPSLFHSLLLCCCVKTKHFECV